MEICFDKRQIAEKVPSPGEQGNPKSSADEIISNKVTVTHFGNSRHKGGEGSDYRDKSGQNDRLSSVFILEFLCFD